MAKKTLIQKLIDSAKELKDPTDAVRTLMRATNRLDESDKQVVLDEAEKMVDAMPASAQKSHLYAELHAFSQPVKTEKRQG